MSRLCYKGESVDYENILVSSIWSRYSLSISNIMENERMKPKLIPHVCKSEPNCEVCRDYINKLDDYRQKKFSIPLPHYIKTNGNRGG